MKRYGNLSHYPYFPMLLSVFFSSVSITFNIYPWINTFPLAENYEHQPENKRRCVKSNNMEQSVYSSKQVICCFLSLVGKKRPMFSTTKLTPCWLSQPSCRNITSRLIFYSITVSLLSAIPQKGKTMLKQECFLPSTQYVPLAIEKLTCKTIYNALFKHQHIFPPTAEKRFIDSGFIFQERQKIYSRPFRVTNEVRLFVFQYNIDHNILYKKKKKKTSHEVLQNYSFV